MRLRIEAETLSNELWFPIFNVALIYVEAGRHTFDFDQVGELRKSNWFKSLPMASREIISQGAKVNSFKPISGSAIILIDQRARLGGAIDFERKVTTVAPIDALRFLAQPFSIVLENEWYDGSFLLWMAKALNFQTFLSAYRRRLFQFRDAGGKGELARSSELLTRGVWPRSDGAYDEAWRLWNAVILDNDADYPGHDPNNGIREACRPHSAWVRQLSRRSIESYLPQASMLRLFPKGDDHMRVYAFFRLTDRQRCHYHLKKGFMLPGSTVSPTKAVYAASDAVDAQTKALYASVADDDWPLLAVGFGSGLSKIFVEQVHRPEPGRMQFPSLDIKTEIREMLQSILESV